MVLKVKDPVKTGKKSKRKGGEGEREFRDVLRNAGLTAERGRQNKGGPDSPDVVCKELGGMVHFEVKRCEGLSIYPAMEQARNDAGPFRLPVVAHRRNGKPWLCIVPAADLIAILKKLYGGEK